MGRTRSCLFGVAQEGKTLYRSSKFRSRSKGGQVPRGKNEKKSLEGKRNNPVGRKLIIRRLESKSPSMQPNWKGKGKRLAKHMFVAELSSVG